MNETEQLLERGRRDLRDASWTFILLLLMFAGLAVLAWAVGEVIWVALIVTMGAYCGWMLRSRRVTSTPLRRLCWWLLGLAVLLPPTLFLRWLIS